MKHALQNLTKIGVLCALPFSAEAQDLCHEVRAIALSLQQGAHQTIELNGVGDCRAVQERAGAKGVFCQQAYPYRAADATSRFMELNRDISECLQSQAVVSQDQTVNHPDFYDLYQYNLDQVTVSVSLKDKASLQQTFVFLRITGMQIP
ncbi:hypothetical protein [Roseovarius sp. EL26]|uniref:hypothetical protein n=1 Tax=Roseovarius sp. EL26 TaxID=2126672 RepID=UPI000EA2AB51|nr:hypothetical protein [Roseovarius sp. EL26]